MANTHKKVSTEKDAGFLHTKMSAENVIPFVHVMSDHNVLASETRANERLKEEEELEGGPSVLRVQTAHSIPSEGHAYERLKEEVPFRESTEEEEIVPFRGFRLVVNSSSRGATVRVVAVVASAWIMCMLWQ